ncbi:MAG: hypothetical protein AABN33_08195 [Acidobacteriota bacterium]
MLQRSRTNLIVGDAKLDLAVANGSYDFGGSASVLLGKGDGTFGGRTDYPTGGYVIWVSFSDDAYVGSERGLLWVERTATK